MLTSRSLVKYKFEITLFFTALATQLIVFFITLFYGSDGFLWSSDAEGYFEIGKNLVAGKGFVLHEAFGPQALRPPLYPLFVAFLYFIFTKVEFIILTQNLLAALVVVLVFILGKKFFDKKVGFFAAVLFMAESQRLQVANQVMAETLFLILFILSIYFFLHFLEKKNYKNILWSGFFLGLTTLVRPITQYLPFILIAFMFIWSIKRLSFRKILIASGLFIVTFALVITPWLVRNKIQFNTWSLSATGGANLFYVNAMHFLEAKYKKYGVEIEFYKPLVQQAISDLKFHPQVPGDLFELFNKYGAFEFKHENYLQDTAIKIIATDPIFYTKLHLKRSVVFLIESSASRSWSAMLKGLHLPDSIFYPFLFWSGRALWTIFMIIIFGGLLLNRTWKDKVFLNYIVFGLIILYFANLAGLNYDAPRMRLPVNPLIFLILSDQIFRFRNRNTDQHSHNLDEVYKQVPPDYWDKSYKNNLFQRLWHSGTFRAIRKLIDKLPVGSKLLDVGCGSGFTLDMITRHRRDLNIMGVDVAEHLIEYARKVRPQINFLVSKGEKLSLLEFSFDCVSYLDVLEHLVDPDASLQEARRVLKPGGKIIVLVALESQPLFKLIWWFWTHFKGQVWHGAHLRIFTKKNLCNMLVRNGFIIENMATINFGMSIAVIARKE